MAGSSLSSRVALIVLGLLFGGFIGSAIGCVGGVLVGWNVAFHENDGASETISGPAIRQVPPEDFWVVSYDSNDDPVVVRLSDFHHETLRVDALPDAPQRLDTWTKIDVDLPDEFRSAAFQLEETNRDTTICELVLGLSDPVGGWVRRIFRYEIVNGVTRPMSVTRERRFNEWGGEQAIVITFFATVIAAAVGAAIGAVPGVVAGNDQRQPID